MNSEDSDALYSVMKTMHDDGKDDTNKITGC